MAIIKINCGNGIMKTVDVDTSKMLKDVYANGDPVNIKMVTKRIKKGKIDNAFGMAWAALSKGDDHLPTMSMLKFALNYKR